MGKYIDVSGEKVVYSVDGKGPALVFLHGFLGNKGIWKHFVHYFKSDFTVITIDLPGHGESTAIDKEITMEFSACLVKKVLEKEEITSFHVVGHSLGGYVALAYAKFYPKDIKSLTLFNSTARADDEQKQADRLKAVRIFDMNPSIFINEAIKNLFYRPNLQKFSKEVEILTQMAKETSISGAQGSLRGMRLREDLVDWLSAQSFSTLYIAGKYDNTIPLSSIIEQVSKTKASLGVLEDSGHMGFIEERKKSMQVIEEFIT